MSDDELAPQAPQRRAPTARGPQSEDDTSRQIDAVTELVGMLSAKVTKLTERLDAFGDPPASDNDVDDKNKDKPAPWVLYTPPAAAEDQQHRADKHTPRFTVDNFVAWYNTIYVGPAGQGADAIPACWREHPPLAMEIASLTYAWRRANIGPSANVRDAQQWHHQHRPGFAARMATWVHTRCLDGNHQAVGAPARDDRFTAPTTRAEQDDQETA